MIIELPTSHESIHEKVAKNQEKIVHFKFMWLS